MQPQDLVDWHLIERLLDVVDRQHPAIVLLGEGA